MTRDRLTAGVIAIIGLLAAAPARAAAPEGARRATEPSPSVAPSLDPSGVTLYPDQGRLELRGAHLQGARVSWENPSGTGPSAAAGEAACLDAKPAGDLE